MTVECPYRPQPKGVPNYDIDYYSDDVIRDPYPHYAAMRGLGPVVFLPQLGNYALTRYAEVREALGNWRAFSSAEGIMGDQFGCDFFRGASNIVNDPPGHDVIRAAMAAPLLPGELENIRGRVEEAASKLIEGLVEKPGFDGIADLARYLPVTLVRDLVGLPEDGRENMLIWAAAAFDITGIQNERGRRGVEILNEMREWIVTRATPDSLKPGSLTARIRDMVARGELPEDQFLGIMNDYITPSLDTTISATGELLYQLGKNPDQWELLKQNPTLIGNAVDEAVRIGSPIRSFTRYVTADYNIGGVTLPAGARVMMLYASANRDEKKFADADKFDVTRAAHDHLGFGHGVHMCVGMFLAKLEMSAILKALIKFVDRIEVVGTPTIVLNNTIHAFATLPMSFTASQSVRDLDHGVSPEQDHSTRIAVRVADRKVEAEGIVSFEFVSADGTPLPPFEAGAHIDVEIDSGLVRQYSLCNRPGSSGYRIGVLREVESRGGSVAMHERLHPGVQVHIGTPKNFFALDEAAPASVLIAGGIGVTPLMAMAYRLEELGAPFSMHYAVRSRERAAFSDELINSGFGGRVTLYVDNDPSSQKFDVERILENSDPGSHLYCCGPSGFISYVTGAAASLGWSPGRIHVEYFAATPVLTGEAFQVVASRSGKTFEIPGDKTILEILQEEGIYVPSSCKSGVCGTCITKVLGGTPEHRDNVQTEEEKSGNLQIAVCCSRSRTRQLILDL